MSQAASFRVEAGFTRVIEGSIVHDGGNSYGCTWGDYDNDGCLDLLVSNYGEPPFLYHNNRDGTFSRVASWPGAQTALATHPTAWADFDNDGWLDLLLTDFGGRLTLYRNTGAGSFSSVASNGLAAGASNGGAWGDYDNDGFADLFVANSSGQHNFLYHNNGDGTFTRVTNGVVVNDGGNSQGCAFGDYDNDGWLDLFVANAGGESNPLPQQRGRHLHQAHHGQPGQ